MLSYSILISNKSENIYLEIKSYFYGNNSIDIPLHFWCPQGSPVAFNNLSVFDSTQAINMLL